MSRRKMPELPEDTKQFIRDNCPTMNNNQLEGITGATRYLIKKFKAQEGLKHLPIGGKIGRKKRGPYNKEPRQRFASTRSSSVNRPPMEDRNGNFNVLAFENWLI